MKTKILIRSGIIVLLVFLVFYSTNFAFAEVKKLQIVGGKNLYQGQQYTLNWTGTDISNANKLEVKLIGGTLGKNTKLLGSVDKTEKSFNFFVPLDIKTGSKFSIQLVSNQITVAQIDKIKIKKAKKDKSGVTTEDHFISGNINSKVKVITYTDFECPFCAIFDKTVRTLSKDYGNDVAFVLRNYPLSQIHPNAELTANAAECIYGLYKTADDSFAENLYRDYVEDIFDSKIDGGELNMENLVNISRNLGASKEKMTKCIMGSNYYKKIDRDMKFVKKVVDNNAFGTPYTEIFSGSKKEVVAGAVLISELKLKIDSLLK